MLRLSASSGLPFESKINENFIDIKKEKKICCNLLTLISLFFSVPPEKLSILDEKGVHIPHYILGPYNEGTSINITCVATGGK